MTRTLMILASAWCLVGCMHKPSANVTGVDVVDTTAQGTRLLITLELSNRNDFQLPMPHVSYTVSVDGLDEFSFTDVPGATLPPGGLQTITLPAALASDSGVSGLAYEIDGRVSYRPPGQIRSVLSNYRIPLPAKKFAARGTFE